MEPRIRYEVCPACGFGNAEMKGACPACDNRLFSDGQEEHQRYIRIIETEHRKRNLMWYFGWPAVVLVFLSPVILLLKDKVSWVPGAGAWVGAIVVAWRLHDLKKRREASAQFLAKHKNAKAPAPTTHR
jgi:hypothetical protein